MNDIEFDPKRDAKMTELINAWSKKPYGSIIAPPRFGKTRMGFKLCSAIHNKNANRDIYIIVPSKPIKDQWKQVFKDYKFNINRITFLTKFELINLYREIECDLLILDEGHKIAEGEKGMSIIRGEIVQSKWGLNLTATPIEEVSKYFPIVASLTEAEAKFNGWISSYYEYNIPVELNEEEKESYSRYHEYISETLQIFRGIKNRLGREGIYFDSDYDIIQSMYSGKRVKYNFIEGNYIRNQVAHVCGWSTEMDLSTEYYSQVERIFSPSNLFERSKTFNEIVRKRNAIINSAEEKIKVVYELVKYFKNEKIITYSQSTKFADAVTEYMNREEVIGIAYHSNLEKRPLIGEDGALIRVKTGKNAGEIKLFGKDILKKVAIQSIKDGTLRVLNSVESLNEGLNIPDLNVVIITSGDCNFITNYQRKSRALTITEESNLAYIVNVYVRDFTDANGNLIQSRDLTKLKLRQNSDTVIWIDSIEEINYNPDKIS